MATMTQVEYPSSAAFSGTAQVDFGPFFISNVNKLLRHEVRGQVNTQGAVVAPGSVFENAILWAVQWVPAGNSPSDIVTTIDGPQFPIREQLGSDAVIAAWSPATANGEILGTLGLRSFWAGQLVVGQSIDLYLSLKTPNGSAIQNSNLFASLRTWWS